MVIKDAKTLRAKIEDCDLHPRYGGLIDIYVDIL